MAVGKRAHPPSRLTERHADGLVDRAPTLGARTHIDCGNGTAGRREDRRAVPGKVDAVDLHALRVADMPHRLARQPPQRVPFPTAVLLGRGLQHVVRRAGVTALLHGVCRADRRDIGRPLRAFMRRSLALEQHEAHDEPHAHRGEDSRGRDQARAMAAGESHHRVPLAVGARDQRLARDQPAQLVGELGGAAIASVGVAGKRLAENRVATDGKRRCEGGSVAGGGERRDRRRSVMEQAVDVLDHRPVGRIEWWLTSEKVVEQRAESPDIAAGVDRSTARLLGAHVGERAHRALGCRGHGRVAHGGDAEVDDLRRAIGADDHIAGLDVAVDHARAMCMLDRIGNLGNELDACERVESVIVGPSVERHRVLDQLHDDEWRIVVVVVALVAEALRARRINPRNVGMLEPRERLGLDAQTAARACAKSLAANDLDRHPPTGKLLRRRVNRAHAAVADEFLDAASAHKLADHGRGK